MFKKIAIVFAVTCFVGLQLNANEQSQVDCSKNLLLSYFPESVVNEVLGDYRVPQDLWPAINADLAEQETVLVNIVDQKSKAIQENSTYDVRQKDVVVGIYRETLYEVFAEVLKKYGIDRKAQAEAMLDQIQYKKGKLFNECMQSKQKTLELQPEVSD